ncbi:MAG: helix-turn-helix domain-containing protein [Haloarculaceae archaeon]
MSVIAEISIPSGDFELGRIVELTPPATAELESFVPVGGRAVPYFWVYDADFANFEDRILDSSAVEAVEVVDAFDDRVLYTIDWTAGDDPVFRTIRSVDAYVLNATGTDSNWQFELRFPSRDAMSTFQAACEERAIPFEVHRVYNPSEPRQGPWFGLTDPQREALVLAVERGYYDIPRTCTTVELAEELGISDQAVTERLRRAINTLTNNTVLTT